MTDMMLDMPTSCPGTVDSGETEEMNSGAFGCSYLRVGRVIAITPAQAIILLERRDAAGKTDLIIPLEMGTLVKLHSRVSIVYGMITGLWVPLPKITRVFSRGALPYSG